MGVNHSVEYPSCVCNQLQALLDTAALSSRPQMLLPSSAQWPPHCHQYHQSQPGLRGVCYCLGQDHGGGEFPSVFLTRLVNSEISAAWRRCAFLYAGSSELAGASRAPSAAPEPAPQPAFSWVLSPAGKGLNYWPEIFLSSEQPCNGEPANTARLRKAGSPGDCCTELVY